MSLRVSARTLDRVDWPQLVERLRAHARTPGGRRRCDGDARASLFTQDVEASRTRLAETSEARKLLETGATPALGGVAALEPMLRRAERGGVLPAAELLDLASTLEAVHGVAALLRREQERAPRLAARGESGLGEHRELARAIARALDPEGQVRDEASPELAEARAATRRLGSEISRRLERTLRDPELAPHLSDRFVTLRNDRYVLPVRSDARARVPGIVHDASGSGTTLFVEPEAVVDLNNRLKEAELRAQREIARMLRELSEAVGADVESLRDSLATLEELDLAFARGALSRELGAVEPTLARDGSFVLPQLRHPLLPRQEAVANDVRLGEGPHVLVLSGPNAGGKTVLMKGVALAALCVRAGLHVTAAAGARVAWVEGVLADIGDAQSVRESLSTFSAHMANLAHIVEASTPRSLVVLDEIGDGTDPAEGAALAQAILEALASAGARVVATTHYNLLKEMAAVDPRFENASFEFDPESLAPTYRLRVGVPGASSAAAVAARMGLRRDVLERADALLAREDRRLERMLRELAESRIALERERHEAERVRAQTEAERDEVRRRLDELQQRRDRLFRGLKRDLEGAFRDAHAEVAGVIRELQRGGSARDAARARERLVDLEARTRQAEADLEPAPAPGEPVDWPRARPGDRVRLREGGEAELLALPDRRGRVALRVGSARMLVPAERVQRASASQGGERRPAPTPRVAVEGGTPAAAGGVERVDLRGLRVEEALGRVAEALDRATLTARAEVVFVHGLGTGRLRDAVREHLASSPYVTGFAPGDPERGGEGITVARLDG